EVALMVVRQRYMQGGSLITSWWLRGRYLTGGIDQPLAGRFRDGVSGTTQNLALITDRTGGTLSAMKVDGTQEGNAVYFSRNPWGMYDQVAGSGSTNTQTGFGGASTPNGSGGFVYLRNRWYDPRTGRFLTQDPIGLAGGVNLYSYAGNNPVAYSDPFGLLCKPYPECLFQEAANRGAQRGGFTGWMMLNSAAVENGVSEALRL